MVSRDPTGAPIAHRCVDCAYETGYLLNAMVHGWDTGHVLREVSQ